MKPLIPILIFLHSCLLTFAQEKLYLYPNGVPNEKASSAAADTMQESNGLVRRVIRPTLELYLPQKENASGTAVIICPGGSYKVLVYEGEGIVTAKALAKMGIAAFVLQYRLPDDSFNINKTIAPLQDAQQAIKTVRENASRWGIDPGKIGIMGFSAGGHLAATAATHFEKNLIENKNGTSLRPDFQILVYPVISMQDALTHPDSRNNLLGKHPSIAMIDGYSNELQVTPQTPPAYITHAGDDKLVDVDNSIRYYEALRRQPVAAEMHLYPAGGHGFIFRHKGWMEPLFEWMRKAKLITTTE